MTQIQAPALPAGITAEQMQAMIAFFMQNQATSSGDKSEAQGEPVSETSSSTASSVVDSIHDDDIVMIEAPSKDCPPTPVKTPPRRKANKAPPATPRAPGNSGSGGTGVLPTTSTPSSKMAQLTLDGRKLSSTPVAKGKRRPSKSSSIRKGPVPTGEDPILTFEDVDDAPDGKPSDASDIFSGGEPKKDAGEESDPYEGFPEIVRLPPAKKTDKVDEEKPSDVTPKATPARRSRYEPTTPRWMETRRTRKSSQSSPPAVQTSPKKKARIVSPTVSPVPSPSSKAKQSKDERMASPFESPDQGNAADVRALKRILESVRSGAKIPGLAPLLQQARDADLLDTEAECSDGDGEDDEDEDGNLEGFVVGDDVVEYDNEVPALPDDEEEQTSSLFDNEDLEATPRKRLYRRSRDVGNDAEEDRASDVEIVDKPNKGKGRAPPPPPSPPATPKASGSGTNEPAPVRDDLPWQDSTFEPANCDHGLHPGSTAVDANAAALQKLAVGGDDEPPLDLSESRSDILAQYGFYLKLSAVPGGCALILSDYKDDGWGNPPVDIVAMAETHIHLRNLLRGLLFRVQGPYVNAAQVNIDDIVAVLVSPPNTTQRYKVIKTDTRAPAVFITGGIARYWRLDTPTTGSHPIKYLSVTQFESCFDRSVAVDCAVFGKKELSCVSFNNAIRYSTLPVFDRPAAPPSNKVKTSSSIRRSGTSQSSRRAPNFEASTNDVVPVYDARKVALPRDISTWQSALPLFEGPLPKNAVVFVAHTTNMWVGTRSTTSASSITHNIQYNLIFVVIVGVLPIGYV